MRGIEDTFNSFSKNYKYEKQVPQLCHASLAMPLMVEQMCATYILTATCALPCMSGSSEGVSMLTCQTVLLQIGCPSLQELQSMMSELLGASGTGLPADLCLSCLAAASHLSAAGNWQTNINCKKLYYAPKCWIDGKI